jgi:hypothetical protein
VNGADCVISVNGAACVISVNVADGVACAWLNLEGSHIEMQTIQIYNLPAMFHVVTCRLRILDGHCDRIILLN